MSLCRTMGWFNHNRPVLNPRDEHGTVRDVFGDWSFVIFDGSPLFCCRMNSGVIRLHVEDMPRLDLVELKQRFGRPDDLWVDWNNYTLSLEGLWSVKKVCMMRLDPQGTGFRYKIMRNNLGSAFPAALDEIGAKQTDSDCWVLRDVHLVQLTMSWNRFEEES